MVFQNDILAGASAAAEAYDIEQSCRFEDGDSPYLHRTPGSAGNQKTNTISCWVKRGNLGIGVSLAMFSASSGDYGLTWYLDSSETDFSRERLTLSTGHANLWMYDRQLRDPAGWYHFVFAMDTTQGTQSDRMKVYINGEYVSSPDTNALDEDTDYAFFDNVVNRIGSWTPSGGATGRYMEGYMAEIHFIDGAQKAATDFGKTDPVTGQWIPIEYEGTYGTQGAYLAFQDSSALGDDTSGNGNDWTSSGLAAADQVVDTPTDNYCVLNVVRPPNTNLTFSEGNLKVVSSSGFHTYQGTFQIPATGKWYCEIEAGGTIHGTANWDGTIGIGTAVADESPTGESTNWQWGNARTTVGGEKYNGSGTNLFPASSLTAGSIVMMAIDMDNSKIWWGVDGSWMGTASGDNDGNPATGANPAFDNLSGELFPTGNCEADTQYWNFGQLGFAHTPPSGFEALSTANLGVPTIKDPSAYFQPTIYTGDGASSLAINQVGPSTFEPDFVWIKNRDATDPHCLFDSSRGVEKLLSSDATTAESTDTDTLKTFDSDGFTVGADVKVNTNTEDYIAWQWKEGATPGFDVGLGVGGGGQTTVAHNLGVVPNLIIWKSRDATSNWFVWSDTFSDLNDHTLFLNTTVATVTSGYGSLYGTQTSSQTSILTSGVTDGIATGDDFVVYAFAAVEGYSAFGTYTGNGNANGPFIYTGFKPRFQIIKAVSRVEEWSMRDTARSGGNFGSAPGTGGDNPTGGNGLQWNLSANGDHVGEDNPTGSRLTDFLSNGFKIRNTNTATNENDATYLYMAWARSPFKYATAR